MGRLIAKILAWLAILLGLALLIQPTAAQWWTSTRNAKTAAQFAARAEAQPTAPAAEETTAEPPEPERAYPELYAAMQDYNAEIYAGGQSGLTDPFAYEEAPLDLAAYGYDDDVLAVLWIPRLNLELPVYLGASRENLAKGAALLGQTSMPLGGENTNTVIAAHRGYYGAEMLRNVQQIQVRDKIQLTTPWETLIYRVSELKIIDPSDINAVLIQPGRDLLTLSTCHPYTRNSQRYLVIAEHDTAAADTTKEEDLQESAATWDETPRQVTVEDAGGSYDGTTWQAPDADAFDSAAMNWKTEDNARLTIASLPFLRTAYDGTAQPQTLTVERIHADTQYTYAPYNAYWGDYYTIQGDGAAAGQTVQDDVFLYYPRDTAQTQLEARADADPSVLDRMEASYAAYAASRYTAVPDGYDELQTLCDEAKKDQKLTEAADIGDYIRAYLNTNYQYNASAPQPPEGADPIRYFLTESKQGYSVQFASAAVVMFRMFGLPARYVVGYAAPQSLFTQQEDGSWHAILQDDNAHAWAEVYISGQGWTPMEMTPDVLVSAQQADLRTDPLPETQGQDTAPAAGESSANEPAATIVPRSRLVLAALLGGCLLAAAVLLVLARRHAMGYGRGSCNARVLAVFGSIYRLLVRRGLPPDTPSDAPEFAAFLQSCVPALEPQDAEALLALAQAAQFGAGTMTEQDTDKMRKLYHVIKHTGKRKQSQE